MTIYIKEFKDDDSFPAASMVEATIQLAHTRGVESAIEIYRTKMEEKCSTRYVEEPMLEQMHGEFKKIAISHYRSGKKMGGRKIEEKFEKQLIEKLDDRYGIFKAENKTRELQQKLTEQEKKNIMKDVKQEFGFLELIGRGIRGGFNAVCEGVAYIAEEVKEGVKKGIDAIADGFTEGVNAIADGFTEGVNAIAEGITERVNAVQMK
eukprot:TRINITY_DN17024_c0_g1_i9.p1 TRINITY_DN17024_c0_g1~~TRINITY_DN17024_c0_g1_i9.p1  ORF type:complete len:207 (+),score=45.41 TRINITY_DN17024_c0_g1_i9:148-768(+)